jgi:diadenylate cyclase
MSEFFRKIWEWIYNRVPANGFDIIDIVIVTVAIYHILKFFKNSRAMNVLKGVALLIVALAVASWLHLPTVEWLLSSMLTSGIVIVFVLFQPEIRTVLENFGRVQFSDNKKGDTDIESTVGEIVAACDNLSRKHIGALIVFENSSSLNDIAETGTRLDASISQGLIENVFEPNTPLHDGAMIISGEKIVAASCFLPLSENSNVDKALGTRHRAALGMSERSDATILIVSEETGVISVAKNGRFTRYLDLENLKNLLTELYTPKEKPQRAKFLTKLFTRLFGKEQDNG